MNQPDVLEEFADEMLMDFEALHEDREKQVADSRLEKWELYLNFEKRILK